MDQADTEHTPRNSMDGHPAERSSPGKVGLCRHDDPDAWFAAHKVLVARAVRICFNCPAQPQCARNALDGGETDGVWAGVKLPGRQEWNRETGAELRGRLETIAAWELNPAEHQRRLAFAESMDLAAATRAPENPLIADLRHSRSEQVKYSA